LLRESFGPGVNLPTLLHVYLDSLGLSYERVAQDRKEYMRYYMRLKRFVDSLAERGLVRTSKIDGFIWARPLPKMVDLMLLTHAKLNQGGCDGQPPSALGPHDGCSSRFRPQHPARIEARTLLKRKKRLDLDDWFELNRLLEEYIEDTSKRVIVLKHVELDEFKFLRYEHRFTKRRLKKALREFDRIWEVASSRYNVGVFITLTMNPSTYNNMIEALDRMSKAFNRFMRFLSTKEVLGLRPLYIKALEPQNSGNPHLHVVLFGVHRIMDHYKLTKFLEDMGFGSIHYEYKIVKDGNGNWVWARSRPRDAKTNNVKDYLKKYLLKTFSSLLSSSEEKVFSPPKRPKPELLFNVAEFKASFYFASNRRFYTCSRQLLSKPNKGATVKLRIWIFVGSWRWIDLPDWILEAAKVTLVEDDELGWRVEPILAPW